MEQSIDQATEAICKAAAEAVRRYVTASGMEPIDDMPEFFISATVLDMLREKFAVTLETRIGKLWDFERYHRTPQPEQVEWQAHLARVVHSLGRRPKVDLVLYQGDPAIPDETVPFLLTEFKKGWIANGDLELPVF